MADRARRVRRQISDDISGSEGDSSENSGEDYDPRRADAMRRGNRDSEPRSRMPPKRSSAGLPNNTGSKITSLKIQPSKLREVSRASEADSLRDTLGGGQVIDGPRRRRVLQAARQSGRNAGARSRYQEFGEDDIEDDDDEEMDDLEQMGGEPEATDEDDQDVDMRDASTVPKPVKITLKQPTKQAKGAKPTIKFTPANIGPVKSVEAQEMQDDPGDEEVEESSDLSNDEEDDDEDDDDEDAEGEDEEETALVEEDAEGEEDVDADAVGEEEELEDGDDDDDDDSDDDTGSSPASGAATPDATKLTKRQRGQDTGGLISLEMGPQQRKFFTDAEKAMKKDEHARKRKELTKRKIQEEKTAALNRLLKPQAGKSRGAIPKAETLANLERQTGDIPIEEEEEIEKANPYFTRWISDVNGVRLAVPEDWKDKYVGQVLYADPYSGPKLPQSNGRLVQELD